MAIRLLHEYRAASPIPPPQLSTSDRQLRNPVDESVHLSTSPFGGMDVWPSIHGNNIITWTQNKHFKKALPEDTVLVLEFNYSGAIDDGWITISEQPLTYFVEDRTGRWHGHIMNGYYRLKLVAPGVEYVSDRISLFGKLSFTEYRTALRILRAENRKVYHKSAGYFLKRRWIGTRCTRCNNPLINNAEQEKCPICYATGFIGGYFKPKQCAMEITLAGSNDKVDPNRGPVNDGSSTGRITALYTPEMNDVWVDSTTGVRWRIQGNNVIVHLRSVPVVLQCQMMRIPASDIVYAVERNLG